MRCIAKLYDVDQWRLISYQIKERDHYRCLSCLKRMSAEKLTVHHLFSRELGGDNDPDNLVTLCFSCHDEIEDMDYMTAEQIKGYNAKPEEKRRVIREESHRKELEEILARIDADRPEWHKWVYGGERNPYQDGRKP